MKQIILIVAAVLMAVSAYAQYPNTTNKMRLGIQTTGDGLLYRHAGAPNWTPTGINNAWQSIDTLTGDLYTYRNGTWFLEVKGDLQQVYPVVINKSGVNIKRGEVVSVDTSQIVQGDQIRIMRAIGDGGLSPKLIMGVAATDINNDATGYVAWFGYVREAVEANIAETGVTLNVGDILYLSATQPGRLTNVEPTPPALKSTIALLVRKPNANNLTMLVRPELNEDLSDLNDVDLNGVGNGQTIVWDSINTKWIAGNVGTPIDTSLIATKSYVDSKVDSTRLTQDSILVYYIGGAEVGRDTLSLPPAGVTSITAGVGLTGGTITSTGTIAADTATVLATKDYVTTRGYLTTEVDGSVTNEGVLGVGAGGVNTAVITSNTSTATGVTLNGGVGALVTETTSSNGGTINVAVDTANIVSKTFLTNQGYSSGGVTGSGTTNTVAKFTGSTAIGNSLITDDGTNVAVGGTASLRLPSGTTAQRPGTPSVGMARNNTTNNNLDFYTGTAWENYLKSATATGLGTAGRVFYADANGRATDTTTLNYSNNQLNSTYLQSFNGNTHGDISTCNNVRINNGSGYILPSSGAIDITIPASFFGTGRQHRITFEIEFAGNITIRPSNILYVTVAYQQGQTPIGEVFSFINDLTFINFRFGRDANNNLKVYIGELNSNFSFRSFKITNVTLIKEATPVSLPNSLCNGWNISVETSAFQNATTERPINTTFNRLDKTFVDVSRRSWFGQTYGLFGVGNETTTGAYEFTLTKTSNMNVECKLSFDIVHSVRASQTVNFTISANINFNTLTWSNASVDFMGGTPTDTRYNIRLGNDGTNLKIWIGELNTSTNNYSIMLIKNIIIHQPNRNSVNLPLYTDVTNRSNWSGSIQTIAFNTVNQSILVNSRNAIPYSTTLRHAYSNNFTYNPTTNRLAVGDTTSVRTLTVNGEARISDLTTDTPTRIVGADADGDLGQIRIGTGLTLAGDTLNVTATGATNLTFSGASSPVTLNSDTGTDVTFTAGDGISFSQTSNNLTISKGSPIYAVITVDSNRTSTFLAASVTPDTIDNPKLSQVGGVFSVVGNGIQYTSGTARTFLITANADFKFSEANNIVKFQGWRSNGGTVIDLGTFGTVESVLGNEIMHTSFTAITSLSNNDLLRFGFTPAAHTGDDTLVLTNLSITITQL